MITFTLSFVLMVLVDTLLVGFAFSGLKHRFQWQISARLHFTILVFLFAFLDNYIVPFIYALDATVTIHNQEIAKFFEVSPNTPIMSLFDPGFFDFIIWLAQALFAGIVGERIYGKRVAPVEL